MAGPRQPPSSATPSQRGPPISLRDIIIIRLINAWYLATFFQPDEFFQVLEPAWNLAFGSQSGAWLTWEWQYQLRSSLHPILFSGAYLLADRLSAIFPSGSSPRSLVVVIAPRVLQAVIAALGDWYTWKLSEKIYNPDKNVSFVALFLQLLSPWQWYCSTRTFSNSLETTLTIAALYYWPWQLLGSTPPPTVKENPKSVNAIRNVWELRSSLCLAALAVVLRPTNALIWLTIVSITLTRVTLRGSSPLTVSAVLVLVREAVICGSLIVGLSAIGDRLYFGFWTFPPYNWLNFNISKSLAVFYGRNPWHYYILQGIPLLCTTSLPFAIPALFKPASRTDDQGNTLKALSYTVFVTNFALSLISHKEVRFIYPLLPILTILSAPRAADFFTSIHVISSPQDATPKPAPPPKGSKSKAALPTQPLTTTTVRRARLRNKPYLFAMLGVNILLAGYLSFVHQAAPLSVLSFLRKEYERIHPVAVDLAHTTHYRSGGVSSAEGEDQKQEGLFALFLMPCHSTPWRSHLVYPNLTAYALSCEPPLLTEPNTPERDNYRDEADRFYDDPQAFLATELFSTENAFPTPRYIIGFEGIEPWLGQFLRSEEGQRLGMKPKRVWAGFNGFFNEDWRRAGHMIVWDTGVYKEDGNTG